MKYHFIFIILTFKIISQGYANNLNDTYEQQWQTKLKQSQFDNDKLSDEALMIYLEDVMKYLPEKLSEIKNQTLHQKHQTLKNVRDYHSAVGISIAELISNFEASPDSKEMFAQMWANDTLGIEYAEHVQLSLSDQEYRTIIDTAKQLISSLNPLKKPHQSTLKIEHFPNELDFINIERIDVGKYHCDIYLYKGIGSMKSIGYSIKKDENNRWQIYHFNYLKSMDKTLITIDETMN